MPRVITVGAGPVGLTATAELLRRGVATVCVDSAPGPSPLSKALLVWPRTMEILRALGGAETIRREGLPVESFRYYSSGRLVARIGFDTATRPVVLPQPHVVRMLAAAVARLDGTVEWGTRLTALVQDADGVSAGVTSLDGAERELRADYVLGADGAGSTVRQCLAVGFDGSTYEHMFMLADARIEGRLRHDAVHYFCSPRGVLVLIGLPDGRFRVFTSGPPQLRAQDVNLALLQQMVDERGPGALRLLDDVWTSTFSVHTRLAARYRVGRAFLAGDAAHIHSPAGGQGMNTGILDAHAVAWRLALVQRGHATPELLDTYEPERAHVARGVVRQSDRQTRAWLLTSRTRVALRDTAATLASATRLLDRVYVPQLTGHHTTYPLDDLHPRLTRKRRALTTGMLIPDAQLRLALAHDCYTLLIRTPPGGVPRHLAAAVARCTARRPGLQVRYLDGDRRLPRAQSDLPPPPPGASRRSATHRRAALAVLVRPDGYIDAIAAQQHLALLADRIHALLPARVSSLRQPAAAPAPA